MCHTTIQSPNALPPVPIAQHTPYYPIIASLHPPLNKQSPSRVITILSSHRPQISQSLASSSATSSSSSSTTTLIALDFLPKTSLYPALANIQLRNRPRDTFNPSHRVGKRRHGFLSRLRNRTGKMTLKRRKLKLRSTLSH